MGGIFVKSFDSQSELKQIRFDTKKLGMKQELRSCLLKGSYRINTDILLTLDYWYIFEI